MIETFTTYIFGNSIGLIATLVGLLYLYLEYKASIWMWLASIVMAVFYIYIFYTTQLFASMTIYSYFLVASVYGWIAWARNNRESDTGEHIILRVPKKHILFIVGTVFVAFILISLLLFRYTDNSIMIIVGDALTTALNIVALWMATRKWAEQWCLLIPANLMSSVLLIIQGESASAGMFFIYFVVSIFGYLNWRRLANVHN